MLKTMYFYPILMNIFIILLMSYPSKKFKIHPLMLNLTLIFITLTICNKMNLLMKSWFPFMLFLSMIGGLMIIFLYITSISNNEFFNLNFKNLILMFWKTTMITILFFYLIKMNYFELDLFHLSNDLTSIEKKFNNFNEWEMSNLFKNKFTSTPTFFIMFYLYYSMICIMNICYKSNKPLRQLKN